MYLIRFDELRNLFETVGATNGDSLTYLDDGDKTRILNYISDEEKRKKIRRLI